MLTEKGFYRPTYDELLEAQEMRAKQLFGDDIDTSNLSVLGKYIRINVSDLDELWQTLEGVYNARFPNTSSGVSLERLCVFAGISRNPATHAKHFVRIAGAKDTVIEGGFLVANESQEQTFHTYEDYVLGANGTEKEQLRVLLEQEEITPKICYQILKSVVRFDEEQLKELVELGIDDGGITQTAFDSLLLNNFNGEDFTFALMTEEEQLDTLVSSGDISEDALEELTYALDTVEKLEAVYATVYAVNEGTQGNVVVGDINTVVNPLATVEETVVHIKMLEPAKDAESDYELRKRFSDTIAGIGSTTAEAIKASVLRVESVESVYIIENDTDIAIDGSSTKSVAPHSFECFVLAPHNQAEAIATAILDKKAVGIASSGVEKYSIADTTGIQHEVRFTWTEEIPIHIQVEIETNALFSDNSKKQIKANVTAFLSDFTNGQTVYLNVLYGEITKVDGVVNAKNLKISTDGKNYSNADITFNYKQVARAGTVSINGEVIASE